MPLHYTNKISGPHINCTISGYAPKPYFFDTFEEAQQHALSRNEVHGITLEGGKGVYTLRKGSHLKPSRQGDTSWFKAKV